MSEVTLGNEVVTVTGGPMALLEYQREFSDEHGKANWYADYSAALETPYGFPDPLFLLKTCWAMAKCADKATEPFDTWARDLDIPMNFGAAWEMEVWDAIVSDIFRLERSEAETPSA